MATNAYFLNQYKLTTLSVAGGIDDSQTTDIVVQDITGVEIAKPGICAITYADPIDTTKIEYVTYTSINDSTKALVGVTRGAEGSTAKAHANGAVVAFSIISESHINNLATALTIDGVETNMIEGVISPSGTSTSSGTELVTKSYADGGLVTSLSRQALINGNFDVWQRGASVTNSNSESYLADRWDYLCISSSMVSSRQSFTVGQSDVPNNPTYFSRSVVTTSSNAASASLMKQKVESVKTFSGQTVTLSFWAKADANKNISIEITQNFGSGGSPSGAVTGIGVIKKAITTSWVKHIVTIALPSISGKTLGTTDDGYLEVKFWFEAGSNYNTSTDSLGNQSGTFDIAQVQLCAGEVALPFQPKSFAEELENCKRYFERIKPAAAYQNLATGFNSSTTNAIQNLYYTEKRAIPTISFSSVTEFGVNHGSNTATRSTGITAGAGASRISSKMARIDVTVASGLTAGQGSSLIGWDTAANTYIDVSSEL